MIDTVLNETAVERRQCYRFVFSGSLGKLFHGAFFHHLQKCALSSLTSEKKKKRLKQSKDGQDSGTAAIYVCRNSAAGFGVRCALRQVPKKRKMTFLVRNFHLVVGGRSPAVRMCGMPLPKLEQ